MPAAPTLLVLAAGRSTRFGRPKQLEPVTADGRTLIDLTMADAVAAGCPNAVLVTSPDLEPAFRNKYSDRPRTSIAVQQEPLGTAHAVLQGLANVDGTIVVVNGDDHYGREAMAAAVHHALDGAEHEHALVAYRLDRTLSPSGGVNRAVCSLDAHGFLTSMQEVTGIRSDGNTVVDGTGTRWEKDRMVSMNLWILRPSLFPLFTELADAQRRGEFGLPEVVQAAIAQGQRFRVIPTEAQWTGLTFAADTDLVRRSLSPE